MTDLSPVVDITSLNGVESLFRRGTRDPWGHRLAGRLADLFIYSDVVRFTMPTSAVTGSMLGDPTLPSILTSLKSRDSDLFVPIGYKIDERRKLNPEYLTDSFENFSTWAQNNRSALRRWLQLHSEAWVRDGHLTRVRPRYVFDVFRLQDDFKLEGLAASIGVSSEDILYAFDVVLRYPLYGEMVGPKSYFLAHPIRELQTLPTMVVKSGPAPPIALSFSTAVAEMASSMNLDTYTSFLHEARGVVQGRKVHTLRPGALDLDTTREIASALGLPARLNAAGKILGVAAGVFGVAGAFPYVGPIAAVAGGVVSVASALWTGTLSRSVSRLGWLRWALKWDVEHQASDA